MNKVFRACIALAAFAALAVVPATASATNSIRLYEAPETAVAVPSAIKGTNTGPVLMTDAEGNTLVSCGKAALHGTLEKNLVGTVEGTITSATFEGEKEVHCASALAGKTTVTTNVGNGVPWCVRSTNAMVTDEFQVRGGKCTEASRPITFVLHTANIGTCQYNRSAAIVGTVTTGAPTAEDTKPLHIIKQRFEKEAGSGIFCPTEGLIDMTIDLSTTESGTRIFALNK